MFTTVFYVIMYKDRVQDALILVYIRVYYDILQDRRLPLCLDFIFKNKNKFSL